MNGRAKTRLAEELALWVSRQGDLAAAARCYAAEGALAYAPVVAWLRSPALRSRLAALEPAWATEVASLLPDLLAERPGLARPGPAGEVNTRQRLFEALARAVLERGGPLLLLIDDLQWCDRDTLEWLHFLLRLNPRAQLLLLGTMRDEDAPDNEPLAVLLAALRRNGWLIELPLAPLSADEAASLAGHLSEEPLSPEQLNWLYRESEGNPLFLIETLRFDAAAGRQVAMVDEGSAVQPIRASRPLPLPPRVQGVLQARLSQLSAPARELAGLAAAIGREFTLPVLARVSDQTEDGLVRSLDELWQHRIVHDASGQGVEAYDFTHDKLREVAYNAQSAARRRLLHRRIAAALESVHQARLDAVSGQIAVHYELAGLFDQAVVYYRRAAETARRVYANGDAIRDYRRALALLAGPASRSPELVADLCQRLGDTLHWTAQHEEARAAYQQAMAATAEEDPLGRAELLRKIGNGWRDQGHYPEALLAYADAERALAAVPSAPPEWWHAWIQVLLEINLVHYWQGHVAESDELRARLEPAVEQHGTPTQRAVYFQNLAWTEFRRNRQVATSGVVALSQAALAAQQDAGNQAAVPAAQFAVGFLLLWSGDPAAALQPLQIALQEAEQTGDVSLQARCLTYLTVAHRQRMELEEVRRCAARSLEVAAAAHNPEYVAMARANQAWAAWQGGDRAKTQELGRAALELWRQLPAGHASGAFQWLALWPLIAVALHDGQLAPAVDHARALFDPGRQRVPDSLAASLEQVLQAWEGGDTESTRILLGQCMLLAQQMHYL